PASASPLSPVIASGHHMEQYRVRFSGLTGHGKPHYPEYLPRSSSAIRRSSRPADVPGAYARGAGADVLSLAEAVVARSVNARDPRFRRQHMATLGLIEYDAASPEVRAVYDDILATRKTDW